VFRKKTSEQSVLVVAGEGSGDSMAAPVVRQLSVPAFGLGGTLLGAAGMELVADLSRTAVMGIGAVLWRGPRLIDAGRRLLLEARRRRPRVALLVGFSEFNAWLGPRLRKLGLRVLWYAPPQIWAWRGGRAESLRDACDRMAVILPFEEELWRAHGADAHYVGHPSLERPRPSRDAVRERFGMTPYAEYVAVLPGSRSHEVERHLGSMLRAALALRAERGAIDARVVVAPALRGRAAAFVARSAISAGVSVLETTAPAVLPAFDIALAASGTVTLECAIAEVPPVIGWRAGRLTEALARRLVQTESAGLPNILLGERVFPELLGPAFTADALADEACRLLDAKTEWVGHCRRVVERLEQPLERRGRSIELPSERVARMIAPWLD
jgi:lipid-A-disaccharide synthase